MLKGLWLALAVGAVACARAPHEPAATAQDAYEGPELVVDPQLAERDPQREATDKQIAELRAANVREKERSDAARAQAESDSQQPGRAEPTGKEGNQVLTEEDWAAWRKRVTGK